MTVTAMSLLRYVRVISKPSDASSSRSGSHAEGSSTDHDGQCHGRGQGGGGYGALAPPSRKWAGLQCAHAQRHVITIGLYTLNRCFWRVFRTATDQGRI